MTRIITTLKNLHLCGYQYRLRSLIKMASIRKSTKEHAKVLAKFHDLKSQTCLEYPCLSFSSLTTSAFPPETDVGEDSSNPAYSPELIQDMIWR